MKKRTDDFNLNYASEKMDKKYVNISICKSNISKESPSYYARLCKKSTITGSTLLAMLKKSHPYLDVNMLEMGIKSLIDVIIDVVSDGHMVDFFSLGTFSIKPEGKLELTREAIQYMKEAESEGEVSQDDVARFLEEKDGLIGDEDVSSFLSKKPEFSLCFTPSNIAKKTMKKIDVGFAIKKNRKPHIREVEKLEVSEAFGADSSKEPTIIKVRGDGLKVAGEGDGVGLYVREVGEKGWLKIKSENILHNTPKDIMFILDDSAKKNATYDVFIATKYVRMGTYNVGKKIRLCKARL